MKQSSQMSGGTHHSNLTPNLAVSFHLLEAHFRSSIYEANPVKVLVFVIEQELVPNFKCSRAELDSPRDSLAHDCIYVQHAVIGQYLLTRISRYILVQTGNPHQP
jgi:hypothetical protein